MVRIFNDTFCWIFLNLLSILYESFLVIHTMKLIGRQIAYHTFVPKLCVLIIFMSKVQCIYIGWKGEASIWNYGCFIISVRRSFFYFHEICKNDSIEYNVCEWIILLPFMNPLFSLRLQTVNKLFTVQRTRVNSFAQRTIK